MTTGMNRPNTYKNPIVARSQGVAPVKWPNVPPTFVTLPSTTVTAFQLALYQPDFAYFVTAAGGLSGGGVR